MKIRELFESKSASKPRNFVAKNAKSAGAGAHKDKKRAEKQGDVKHKKQAVPMEGSVLKSIQRGYKTWQVWIKNNYYNGKYADYSARPYRVIAGSADEARQVVLDNADRVLKDLLSKKFPNGKRVLPPRSALPVEAKYIGAVDDGTRKGQITTGRPITLLSPKGPMTVMLDAGNIVDVEQGVAEGSVWSSVDQKMKHHSEFPHTHTAVRDIRSSMSGKVIVPKGARLSELGNNNYLNLDTGVQPFKLDPGSLEKPGVAEGEQQVYKVVALTKSNALAKPTKMKVKADSIEDLFSRLSANDWYPLEINGVEVIAGKRLKQGVAEGMFGLSAKEKAKSKAQQKFMGMVYAAKKGEKPASKEVAKVAKGMSKKSAKDYAATKHKGKPEHVKETATAGATSAGNVSVGAVYKNKPGKTYKNKDGTAKNALDVKGANLLSGGSIKR